MKKLLPRLFSVVLAPLTDAKSQFLSIEKGLYRPYNRIIKREHKKKTEEKKKKEMEYYALQSINIQEAEAGRQKPNAPGRMEKEEAYALVW